MTGAPFAVTLFDGTHTKYLSYVLTGLHELRARSAVTLRYAPSGNVPPRSIPNAHMWLRLARGERALRVFMDLHDAPDIDTSALASADVYFKRSLDAGRVVGRPATEQRRILPIGIHLPCTSRFETLTDRLAAAFALPGEPVRPGRRTVRIATALVRGWAAERYARARPPFLDELMCTPERPAERIAYFRTRLIDPDSAATAEARAAVVTLNADRVALIETLRRRLGARFAGGLYPTPTTLRDRPDLIYDLPGGLIGQRGHLTMSRRCLIAINTAGTHGSTGWKFPESLAASRCLVSEPPVYRSLDDAQPGVHYVPFATPAECADACEALLDEPDRAAALRASAYRFFTERVEPGAALGQALDLAWQSGHEHTTPRCPTGTAVTAPR